MNINHFLRMARWARHPPSPQRVKLVFAVIAFCALLFGLERAGLLPGFAELDPKPAAPKIRPLP